VNLTPEQIAAGLVVDIAGLAEGAASGVAKATFDVASDFLQIFLLSRSLPVYSEQANASAGTQPNRAEGPASSRARNTPENRRKRGATRRKWPALYPDTAKSARSRENAF